MLLLPNRNRRGSDSEWSEIVTIQAIRIKECRGGFFE
jgi:hypothetical protein